MGGWEEHFCTVCLSCCHLLFLLPQLFLRSLTLCLFSLFWFFFWSHACWDIVLYWLFVASVLLLIWSVHQIQFICAGFLLFIVTTFTTTSTTAATSAATTTTTTTTTTTIGVSTLISVVIFIPIHLAVLLCFLFFSLSFFFLFWLEVCDGTHNKN